MATKRKRVVLSVEEQYRAQGLTKLMYTFREAAKLLGIPVSELSSHIRMGDILVGGHSDGRARVARCEIARFSEQQEYARRVKGAA